MSDQNYKIKLITETTPINKVSRFKKALFRHAGKEAYIVGEQFKVIYNLQNIGNAPFNTQIRRLTVSIKWPNGQIEQSSYEINVLQPGDPQTIEATWGVLAPGFSLFLGMLETGPRQEYFYGQSGEKRTSYTRSPLFLDEVNEIRDASFYSVYGQTTEEFYQYWAMIASMFALLYLVFEKMLPYLVILVSFLRSVIFDP